MKMNSGIILVFLLSLGSSLVLGHYLIPMLQRIKAGQNIREDGPQSHLVKAGTPTMGGIIFLLAALIALVVTRNMDGKVGILLLGTLGFAIVGFIDDYIKVVMKRNLGLTSKQKLFGQIFMAVILMVVIHMTYGLDQSIFIPGTEKYLNLGIFSFFFYLFVILGTVNSVNLTDGLDGLSSSVTIIVFIFFGAVTYKLSQSYLLSFCITMIGSLLGYLYYNKYPAKVFMGDTGSLALGGAVVTLAILLNLTLILPLAGGIYFIETLSDIIQVVHYKRTKERVFLMAPLHHHYEHKGLTERQIVRNFSIVQIFLCIISYFLLF